MPLSAIEARLDAATTMAENAAQILEDVANGDSSTTVPTAGGPVNSVAKAIADIASAVQTAGGAPTIVQEATPVWPHSYTFWYKPSLNEWKHWYPSGAGGAWVSFPSVPDAPIDGSLYLRKDGAWITSLTPQLIGLTDGDLVGTTYTVPSVSSGYMGYAFVNLGLTSDITIELDPAEYWMASITVYNVNFLSGTPRSMTVKFAGGTDEVRVASDTTVQLLLAPGSLIVREVGSNTKVDNPTSPYSVSPTDQVLIFEPGLGVTETVTLHNAALFAREKIIKNKSTVGAPGTVEVYASAGDGGALLYTLAYGDSVTLVVDEDGWVDIS